MSDSRSRQTATCHLLRLPPELREQIYRHLFTRQDDYCDILQIAGDRKVYLTSSLGKEARADHRRDDAALLRTCRLLYTEASPVLYDCSKFVVIVKGDKCSKDCLDLGSVPTTQPIWRRMNHVKLLVRVDGQRAHFDSDQLLANLAAWVDPCQENRMLKVCELKLAINTNQTVSLEPVLQTLGRLKYPKGFKVWLATIDSGSLLSLRASLQPFLESTGGRDCSSQFEIEEDRGSFKFVGLNDTAREVLSAESELEDELEE